MDILILDSWLREHLETNAKHQDIAKYLTLCGPSIEKVDTLKVSGKTDYLYHIEVTTNRVDMMSVRGIAREASVILPEFGFKALLKNIETDNGMLYSDEASISLKTNPKLVDRLMGVILEVDPKAKSPDWLIKRLESSGLRSLNLIVDITNYIMTEVGQPTHVFDYDLIKPTISVRESKKGEKVTSFDGKTYSLPGGDIVFENSVGEIVDLPGIIGTKNSVVNDNTKRILFFIDNNDPVRIRKTSMTLGIRTVAATLNEKNVDPEIADFALKRGIYLYKKLCNAKQLSKIYDVYSNKPKAKSIEVDHQFVENILGVNIDSKKVTRILSNLGIATDYRPKTNDYLCTPPTFRAKDVTIPEDIVEEVARIYGYHNLPSRLMQGEIPQTNYDSPFQFENLLKQTLAGLSGCEVYTLSLVSKTQTSLNSLILKNPLGTDTEYLRSTLKSSLVQAANENKGVNDKFHLFEVANIYTRKGNDLPTETMTLSGIFNKYDFRTAKGVIETLMKKLNIAVSFEKNESSEYSKALNVYSSKTLIGNIGVLTESNQIFYEFDTEVLRKLYKQYPKYTPIPKFPSQIEDLTLTFAKNTYIGDVLNEIKNSDKQVADVQLTDIYNENYTFRIWYQHPEKTLSNDEIEPIRNFILQNLKNKFIII